MSQGAVLLVGQAVLDQVWQVHSLVAGAGKHVAQGHHGRAGGLAARAALAALRLRDPARSPAIRLVSALGDDDTGRWLRQSLAADGLCCDAVATVPGAHTGVSAVLVDGDGERQVHSFRGDALSRAPLPSAAVLADAVALQVDPRWPAGAAWALQAARIRGLTAMLDGEWAPTDILRSLLPQVPAGGWAVFSQDGLQAWAGPGASPDAGAAAWLADAAQAAPGVELVVTQGAEGVLWRRPDGACQALPAFRVTVQDTNGAGDTLHGALLLGLAEGLPAPTALRRAMAAAALACTGMAPDRAALDHFLEHS